MRTLTEEQVSAAARACGVADLERATIGETLLVAERLERETGERFVRMDQGSPGLPMNRLGLEAEKRALDRGEGALYPPADGVPELKEAASEFIKAFLGTRLAPLGCVPTAGSVAASFGGFIACCQRRHYPGTGKALFIDPGFPIQKSQLRVLGIEWRAFDIYAHRGPRALRRKLEEELAAGDVDVIVYSNPNNPAWISLEEDELRVVAEMADKHDAVVMEDLAYFAMDSRRDLSRPYQEPYARTVARYTGNCMLLLSSSKIYSYAGQRMGLACVSDALYARRFPALARRYGGDGQFGPTFVASIQYMITSGCTATTQRAYAEMLRLSCRGELDFVRDTREYARRARRMKAIFRRHGFRVAYPRDWSEEIGDGFFFSLSYPGMTGGRLAAELLRYGVSSISLSTAGSGREGVRACVSRVDEGQMDELEERAARFDQDHRP